MTYHEVMSQDKEQDEYSKDSHAVERAVGGGLRGPRIG